MIFFVHWGRHTGLGIVHHGGAGTAVTAMTAVIAVMAMVSGSGRGEWEWGEAVGLGARGYGG